MGLCISPALHTTLAIIMDEWFDPTPSNENIWKTRDVLQTKKKKYWLVLLSTNKYNDAENRLTRKNLAT